jgi:hypothetical protein
MLADPVFRQKLAEAGVEPDMGGGMVGQFGKDLVRAAVDMPAGYASLVSQAVRTGRVPARSMVRSMAEDVAADVRHPLRHPGNTFLDLLTLASLGGAAALRAPRVAAAARKVPRKARLSGRAAAERLQERRQGPDPVVAATMEGIWRAREASVGREAAQAELRAQLKARRAAASKRRSNDLNVFAYRTVRPLVYPVARSVELVRMAPSRERAVDTAAFVFGSNAVTRRVLGERQRFRDAERIVTHR